MARNSLKTGTSESNTPALPASQPANQLSRPRAGSHTLTLPPTDLSRVSFSLNLCSRVLMRTPASLYTGSGEGERCSEGVSSTIFPAWSSCSFWFTCEGGRSE